MDPKYAVISLAFRTGWAAIGVLLGIYAPIRVRKQYRTGGTLTLKGMWWFQLVATPLSALFVLWITLAFRGFVVQLPWQALLIFFPTSLLAFPNASWMLVEASNKPKATTAVTT